MSDLLDESLIADRLSQIKVVRFDSIDSTNTFLLDQPETVHQHLCIAEHQSGGRGRRNRQWQSPYGRNLAMSLGFGFDKTLNELGGLSSVVGVALVEALRNLGAKNVALKWPNDVLVGDQKLCGILIELRMRGMKSEAVVGIGVNVNLTEHDKAAIDQPVTDLRSLGIQENRSELVIALMGAVHDAIARFAQEGFAGFVERFNELHLYHEQVCRVLSGEESIEGSVVGVAENGALMLKVGSAIEHFHGGEVSLRPIRD